MNELTTQVLSINESMMKCQRQLQTINADLEALQSFNGVGYVTIGIGAHSIPFGQLFEKYEDSLQSVLIKLKKQEKEEWETNLQDHVKALQELFNNHGMEGVKVVAKDESPWYPDLPGWTWHEIEVGHQPNLHRDTIVNVLLKSERSCKRFTDEPDCVWQWGWGVKACPIVAYATKND